MCFWTVVIPFTVLDDVVVANAIVNDVAAFVSVSTTSL